uniref:Putative ovule protein n=1 Tax=Solanum chacoense TaxID=4108 RepID=A0A0V0I7A9_SOLCH
MAAWHTKFPLRTGVEKGPGQARGGSRRGEGVHLNPVSKIFHSIYKVFFFFSIYIDFESPEHTRLEVGGFKIHLEVQVQILNTTPQ